MRLQASPSGLLAFELREDDGALSVARHGGCQAFKLAGSDDDLLAAEIPDDALLGAAVLAYALDEVQVGVAVDVLLADEHAELAADSKEIRQDQSAARPHNLALHILMDNLPPQANQWLMPASPAKSGSNC